jgi:adenylate cyclase
LGDSFRIGSTVFEVAQAEGVPAASGRPPGLFAREGTETADELETAAEPRKVIGEHTYSADELRRIEFGNAPKQLDILSGLPQLISASQSDEELAQSLVELLLESIPQAEAVAVVHYDVAALPEGVSSGEAFPQPRMMRVAVRDRFAGRFRPSRRLITKTLKQHESVMQIWSDDKSPGQFTITEGLGWAFAAPIPGDSCRGWCLYVAGKGASGDSLLVSESDLKGDLRFTELVAQFIGSIRQIRLLQEQKTQLSAFFSPKVIENIVGAGSQAILTPAEQEITVLFCDVRGFSRKSEKLKHDLPALLQSVDAALGVMTSSILDRDGAVADFQGDAALGFWGWPVPLEQGPVAACRAALAIWAEFRKEAEDPGSLLHGFSVGIGVAHGSALAGRIGTARQAKIGVFGPVVNRGSRLEGMTKQFGVSICIDETTAQFVKRLLPPSEGRLRRLAHVCPSGMDTPLTVYALMPPERQCPEVTEEMLGNHERALQSLVQGRWSEAMAFLDRLPADDGPAKFLRSYLAEQGQAPPGWAGVIPLKTK